MKRFIATIALAAGVTVLLFGAVTPAHASPVSRAQAVRSAKEYLHVQAFSLHGLISQLKYEGFSRSDATYGARHSRANWMKQAVRAAREYLHTTSFSRSSMVEQLVYDGFTHRQALHGAIGVGL